MMNQQCRKRPLASIGPSLSSSCILGGQGIERATNVKAHRRSSHPPSEKKTAGADAVAAKVVNAPEPAPVAYLKSLLSRSEEGRKQLVENTGRCAFQKPDESFTEAYDMAAVRAIRENDVPKLRELLHEGKSFDACNQFGESLLHMACRRGAIEVVKFFAQEAHVKVDIRDDFGRTPVHDACWTAVPNLDVMSVLLKAAPPSMLLAQDVRGHTPFHYARRDHWDKWIEFLKSQEELILQRVSNDAVQVVG